MSDPIRIMLVDDHAVVREGLRALLEQQADFAIVAEAAEGDEAVRLLPAFRPNVIVLDLKMPGQPATEVIAEVRRRQPNVRILVFTSFGESAEIREVLTAGATGFLLKDALHDDLVHAVREVAAGRAWLHPQAQRHMLEWMRQPVAFDALTARERSVLELLARGLSNKQIARELGLTEGTVKGYVSHVLDKLGVCDRTQAAIWAHKAGIA